MSSSLLLSSLPLSLAHIYLILSPSLISISIRFEATVSVPSKPQAVATAYPSTSQSPVDVQFSADNSLDTNTPAQALSFNWNFGDGFSSTEANPLHRYNVAGVYNVTLVVSNTAGKTDSMSIPVKTNNNPPVVKITSPTDQSFFALEETTTFVGIASDDTTPAGTLKYAWEAILIHNK